MRNNTVFLGVLLWGLLSFNLSAQTKLIFYKSHSGKAVNFSLKEEGNLGSYIGQFYKSENVSENNEKDGLTTEDLNHNNEKQSNNRSSNVIKIKEGLLFNKNSDFNKYKELKGTNGKLGLLLIILNENSVYDKRIINELTDALMKNDVVRYYIRSTDGFIFETKTEYEIYGKLRNKREKMGIKICELKEGIDSLKINQLTDQTMRQGKTVFFIKTKDGAVFDLRSTFENYKILREIKDKNIDLKLIPVSKNDSILKLETDTTFLHKKEENELFPFVTKGSKPNDKTPYLIFIISVSMVIIGYLLWKKEMKKINY